VFEIVKAAGWPIWPLLLASVIAVALILERLVTLRRNKIVPPGLLQRAVGEFRHGADNSRLLATWSGIPPWGGCWRQVCAMSARRVR